MKQKITLFFILLNANLTFAQMPVFEWAGLLKSDSISTINDLKTDEFDNLYVAGSFIGEADFDFGTAIYPTQSNNKDAFIAKYNAQHMRIWSYKFGSAGNESVNKMQISADGFLYVLGEFESSTNFEPGGPLTLTPIGLKDFFLAKYTFAGDLVWVKQFGGPGTGTVNSLAIDVNNTIVIGGNYNGTLDIDPSGNIQNLSSSTSNTFFAKFDSSGNLIWGKQLNSTSNTILRSISITSDGKIILAGSMNGIVDFDPSVSNFEIDAGPSTAGFIAKYNLDGSLIWAKSPESNSVLNIVDVKTNQIEEIAILGTFSDLTDFDPNIGVQNLNSSGSQDLFVLQLNSDGEFNFVKKIGASSSEYAMSLNVDAFNNIFVSGYFLDSINFDPGLSNESATSINQLDGFLTKLNATGNFQWGLRLGGQENDFVKAITFDSQNRILTAGSISNLVNFDPSGIFGLFCNGERNDFVWILNDQLSSIDELDENSTFSLWPNPGNGELIIQIKDATFSEMQIKNIHGQIEFSGKVMQGNNSIDLREQKLSNGIYFISLMGENGEHSTTQKWIINH